MKPEQIKKIIVSPTISLITAMRALSSGRGRILFVVDDNEKLIASVSDGDIRRGILNGLSFNSPVSEVMFKSPRYVKNSDENFMGKAEKYILEEKIFAIPLLDESEKITDVLFWHDFMEKHPLETYQVETIKTPVVLMAGGKGERLDPFTKILPKPLIPFGDKPIIEKIMDNFHKYGFVNFILTLNYRKELIKMYFSENKFPYNIKYIEEAKYLGTAGSLGLLKNKIKETFFVCNCDSFLEYDLKNILLWHKREKALITVIGCHKEMIIPYGILDLKDGYLNTIIEKPKNDMIINTGIYVMEPHVLSLIPEQDKLDMNHLLEKVRQIGKVTVYPICDGWFDLGQWKEYRESLYLLQNRD